MMAGISRNKNLAEYLCFQQQEDVALNKTQRTRIAE